MGMEGLPVKQNGDGGRQSAETKLRLETRKQPGVRAERDLCKISAEQDVGLSKHM
jgi:hypothetical protein